ncbi:S49 family peptidase [Tenacibaculum maritimum]|uniref:S49 family peptidase n=1 Tax=Tenacibaculum maritimum TaxID=107401 RepID=UPI0012E40787|nr:S49 family peptidase [Tenacibaculum maritimum]CAA0157481.1 conserved hypothetical protein [Tenacibaculum maritimum]CAA0170676.1 conserved hypothetical protein [Tenacibaculum maritimum]
MHNILLNQPLSIDKGYLNSLILSFAMGLKLNSFKSDKEIDFEMVQNVQLQQESAQAQGSTSFPVVLNVIGPIVKYSSWNYWGTQSILKLVQHLQNDERVSAIVFNIDSGGGMVSGTAELCGVIKQLSVPTVAFTNGYMCSAAYDIASACDKRVAHPNADLIGSIGTMLSYQDFSAMFEKWGAKFYEIYAPQSSEKNAEFRALLEDNEAPYKARLEYLAQDFIDRISENLGENLKDDGKVLKGKTYTPKQALDIGLIDELATLNDVINHF